MKALVVLVALASSASADRTAHLERALAELAATDPIALDRALYDAIRTRCRAPATVRCMIEIARAHCTAKRCLAAADVIITNQHAERDLLDEQTRIRIVRTATDYHTGVLAELRARYAILAAELALARPAPLAAQIDRLCVTRDQVARRCAPDAPACIGTIAYQRCASALVWFVATEGGR